MTKKSIIKYSFLGVALIVTAYLVIQVFSMIQRKKDIKAELSVLPDVELKNLSGKSFNLQEIQYKNAIAIFYINTECGICHDQMKEIDKILTEDKSFQIILVSGETLKTLQTYQENNTIFNHPKIQLTHDYAELFVTAFDIRSTPHILIYDKDGNIIINQKGFLRADKLMEIFEGDFSVIDDNLK